MINRANFEPFAIWLLLGIYVLLGFVMMLTNPLLESPDELLNYENMRTIIEHKALPVLQPGEMSKAHHPPLYYVIGAIITAPIPNENLEAMGDNINRFFGFRTYDFGVDNKSQYLHGSAAEAWPWHDAALGLYLLRMLSIVFGTGGVLAVYKIGRTLFTDHTPALIAAAIVAFNPMYVYIQSSVHNDALTNFLAACTILSLVIYWQKPSMKQAAIVGTVCGLGILTKITFLFLGPVVFVVMAGRHFTWPSVGRKGWDWKGFIQSQSSAPSLLPLQLFARNILVAGLIVIVLAGWWFVRNQILYGEPTSMELQASIWQPRPNSPDWPAAFRELGYLRDSFWGAFGFGQIVFPRWVYTTMNSFVLAGLAGLVVWLLGFRQMALKERSYCWLLGLLLIAPLTAFGATFSRMAVSATANFGRYLFTSYGVLAILLALGLFSLLRLMTGGRKSADWLFAILLTLGLIGLNVYTIFGVIRPVFAPPPVYATADQVTLQFPLEVEFPGALKLLGYSLDSMSAVPGQPFPVTLYWQAIDGTTEQNFVESVQLVSADGERIAGRDTLHGLGRYPTKNWKSGETVEDRILLYPPEDVGSGPAGLRLNIGLKDESGQAVALDNGVTTLTLGIVRLAPFIYTEPLPVHYLFADSINLNVNRLPEEAMAGETIKLAMFWHSVQAVSDDYVVLIHWVKPGENQPAVQFDGPPDKGDFPTSLWRPGDEVTDVHQITIPADLPTGDYEVLVGLYQLSDFARLPVTDAAGNSFPDHVIPIGTVNVGR
ncbi:MAG: hypothetical protein ACI9EW_001337 [Cellvibrionaceae bacterium]|jgi:hypothetical protein